MRSKLDVCCVLANCGVGWKRKICQFVPAATLAESWSHDTSPIGGEPQSMLPRRNNGGPQGPPLRQGQTTPIERFIMKAYKCSSPVHYLVKNILMIKQSRHHKVQFTRHREIFLPLFIELQSHECEDFELEWLTFLRVDNDDLKI